MVYFCSSMLIVAHIIHVNMHTVFPANIRTNNDLDIYGTSFILSSLLIFRSIQYYLCCLISGKCLEIQGRFHEAHEIISQSISVLVSRNPFTHACIPFTFLLDLVGKELPGDVFSIERAAVLYDISWCSLKSYYSKDNGYFF